MSRLFPDDTGADSFVREYPTAVAPADRSYLDTSPPLLVLRVPGEGDEYERRVRRVVGALVESMHQDGKLVPYTVLEAGNDDLLLADSAGRGLAFGIPRFMTPEKFAHFELLHSLVARLLEREPGAPVPTAKQLRDHAYAHRVERGGLPGLLWGTGGDPAPPAAGLTGTLVGLLWRPVTRTLPRWYWTARKTRQLIRPARLAPRRRRKWLGSELHVTQGRENLFEVMAEIAALHAAKLALPAGHPSREDSLRDLERLLIRALLEDIRIPSVGRFLPKRRRRTARPVLLVKLPEPEGDAARSVDRFLSALHTAKAATAAPGPLVIAVGRPSDSLLEALGSPPESTLSQAAIRLSDQDERGDGEQVVTVTLREDPFTREGLPMRRVRPRMFRTGWQTMTTVTACTCALVASLLVPWVSLPYQDDPCVGGNVAVADKADGQPGPEEVNSTAWFDQAYGKIKAQNKIAESYADDGRQVRTVVLFVADRPTKEEETVFDGTIPELRGVGLWQKTLNKLARANNTLVPLRVEVRETGPAFKNAESKAKTLAAEIGADNGGGSEGYEEVVGVLGFAQSREETRAALQVLKINNIPTIGTTATADEMLESRNAPDPTNDSYWPFTPLNSTEAKIEADFAHQSRIVRDGSSNNCTTAKKAVVVQSPGDLYSKSIARSFKTHFKPDTQVINFSQDGDFTGVETGDPKAATPDDLAGKVCAELRNQPHSVVYWSARAKDFTAFVDALNTQGLCTQRDITVLGGNELTNVALTGEYDNKTWLRLYYSAHRLPTDDEKASRKTKDFVNAYDHFVNGPAEDDPWRQDGHAAVSYDALHTLSYAVSDALDGNEVRRSAVLESLRDGIRFDGATGYVSYAKNDNRPSANRTLVLMRQTSQGPEAVAACGAYRRGETYAEQGTPCAQ